MVRVRGHISHSKTGRPYWRQKHDRAGGGWSWAKSQLKPQIAVAGVATASAVTWGFTAVMSTSAAVLYGVSVTALGVMGLSIRPKRQYPRRKKYGATKARAYRTGRKMKKGWKRVKGKLSPRRYVLRKRRQFGDWALGPWRRWSQSRREALWAQVHRAQRAEVVRDKSGNVIGLRQYQAGRK